ncbi:HAD family hydrolase [Thiorhodovibrio frisius]|uniref:Haloacid dehalogenase superfamily enzyme, subfamily IA n=1 Tax=Thiorhodovibrio frisius TaxID=631362 RepID=H8Z0U4_9GAMM|nr:HAD family hydrolase [Thiorhodovibrio frisius]EIC21326.1 haloacid dehalogenase superfamily enzyme, subfamily IA [Thiorhodovibrio frisius]WPL23909.1 Flavin mononucleotide phosphatase YigB [Thiorhodovibrio frisius]
MASNYRLLTLDLDDTLWPCQPTVDRAEAEFHAWLDQQVPRLAAAHDLASLRRHRRELYHARPDIAHDMTALRQVSLEMLLGEFDYSPTLAAEAVALFCTHRNRVEPYTEVPEVLGLLGYDHRLVSVTNGNAEVALTPLKDCFHHSLTAAGVGAAKPDPAIFKAAMRWAGASPAETLHVGDDPIRDIQAARQCGLDAVWVNRHGQSWPDDLEPPMAEVSDLHGLRAWLEGTSQGGKTNAL